MDACGGQKDSAALRHALRAPAAAPESSTRSGSSNSATHTLAALGLMTVLAASIADFTAVRHLRQDTLAWSFGLNFLGFNVIKIGIGVTLIGIIVRLWMRVDSVKAALVDLKASTEGEPVRTSGAIETDYGRAEITTRAPEPLWIHKLAERMWTPLLVMGPMVVVGGLVLSIVQANQTIGTSDFHDLGAAAQGASILGEALMLSGISFVLGTILSSLRRGGGEVQESAGVVVQTLRVPATVWAFVGLMASGLMGAGRHVRAAARHHGYRQLRLVDPVARPGWAVQPRRTALRDHARAVLDRERAGFPVRPHPRPHHDRKVTTMATATLKGLMMAVLAAAALHVIWATDVHNSATSLHLSAQRFTALAGVERLGIGAFLTAIAFGLATIIHVLRFQTKRIRELPGEPARA
jgi:hypothetical protein